MNQKVMPLQNLYDFSLVRYEPNCIILLDKRSCKSYDFYQLNSINNLKPDVCHPYLLLPVLYKNGAIYPSTRMLGSLQFALGQTKRLQPTKVFCKGIIGHIRASIRVCRVFASERNLVWESQCRTYDCLKFNSQTFLHIDFYLILTIFISLNYFSIKLNKIL